MNRDTLKAAIAEAERFLVRAKAMPAPDLGERYWCQSRRGGDVKRASLDLTRALAELRRAS